MNRCVVLDVRMNPTLSLPLQRLPSFVRYVFFWERQATVLPRRNHLLRDLITHVFLRSLQYGIEVMGFY